MRGAQTERPVLTRLRGMGYRHPMPGLFPDEPKGLCPQRTECCRDARKEPECGDPHLQPAFPQGTWRLGVFYFSAKKQSLLPNPTPSYAKQTSSCYPPPTPQLGELASWKASRIFPPRPPGHLSRGRGNVLGASRLGFLLSIPVASPRSK